MIRKAFKAKLKPSNRRFLDTLKGRFSVKSAAAALNRLLDLERSEAIPQIHFVICGGCRGKVPTVSMIRYVVCPKCQDVFTADNQVRWYLPEKKK